MVRSPWSFFHLPSSIFYLLSSFPGSLRLQPHVQAHAGHAPVPPAPARLLAPSPLQSCTTPPLHHSIPLATPPVHHSVCSSKSSPSSPFLWLPPSSPWSLNSMR